MTIARKQKPTKSEVAVRAAELSAERVAEGARALTSALSNRKERARTHPFLQIEDFDGEEDSLVTKIEDVIATARTSTKDLE